MSGRRRESAAYDARWMAAEAIMLGLTSAMDFDEAWLALDARFRSALAQAWEAFRRQGLPVGAVVSRDGNVVSEGRNRVYDAPGGSDVLQRTALAHAELNAIASVPEQFELALCEIWTTQQPCSMCQAAIEFTGIAGTHFLASDPSAVAHGTRYSSSGDATDTWIVVANVLFLHGVARVAGIDHPFLDKDSAAEGQIVRLARELVKEEELSDAADAGASVVDALHGVWERIGAVSRERDHTWA